MSSALVILAGFLIGMVLDHFTPAAPKPKHNNYWRTWQSTNYFHVYMDGQEYKFSTLAEYEAWRNAQ